MASLPTAPGTSILAWKISTDDGTTWTLDPVSPADLPDGAHIDAVTIAVSEVATIVNDRTAAKVGTPQPVSENEGTQVSINFAPLFAGTNLAFELDPVPTGWSIDNTGLATGPIFNGTVTAKASNSLPTVASQTVEMTELSGVPAGYTAVSTPEELIAEVNADPAGNFWIANDLDLSAYPSWNELDVDFSGVIDSPGVVIRGLKIDVPEDGFLDGFVKQIMIGGVVRNLGFEDVDISAGRMVGAIAGRNHGIVERCWGTGTVHGNRSEVGGLVGVKSGTSARIRDVWSNIVVTQSDSGTEGRYVGGIVGGHVNGQTLRAIVLGPVSSTGGGTSGTPGPICGRDGWEGTDTFFDVDTTGFATDPFGIATGLTTAQMQSGDPALFPGFDPSVWQFRAGHYPRLAWQEDSVAAPGPSGDQQVAYAGSSLTQPIVGDEFDLLAAADPAAGVWVSFWAYHNGQTTDASLLFAEVAGDSSRQMQVSEGRAHIRNGGYARPDSDVAISRVGWHLYTAWFRYGDEGGVMRTRTWFHRDGDVEINGYANGDFRFTPDQLRLPSRVVVDLAWGFGNPSDLHAARWNAGAPVEIENIDFTGLAPLTMEGHWSFIRPRASDMAIDLTDAPFLDQVGALDAWSTGGEAWWWNQPSPFEELSPAFTGYPSGPPGTSSNDVSFMTEPLYLGEPRTYDAADLFDGEVDSYQYDGPEPHVWDGSQCTITPDAVTAEAVDRHFTASNIYGTSSTKLLRMEVTDPPVIAASGGKEDDILLEVGQGIHAVRARGYITGGAWPFVCEKVSGPSWVVVESNGICHGIPDAAHAATDLVVRVTDARGDSVDVALINIQTVAAHDRTSDVMVAPEGEDIFLWIQGNAAPGRYLQLQSGVNYTTSESSFSAMKNLSLEGPPCIVGCPDGTASVPFLKPNYSKNMIFENFRVQTGQGRMGIQGVNAPERIYFKDLVIEGEPTPVDVDDGQDWRVIADFNYGSNGVDLTGDRIVWQNIAIKKIRKGMQPRGYLQAVYGVYVSEINIDAAQWKLAQSYIGDYQVRNFVGAAKAVEHRDQSQLERDYVGFWHELVFDRLKLSNEDSNGYAQGLFTNNASGSYPDRNRAHPDCIIKNGVIMSGHPNHGITMGYAANIKIENMLVVGHPDIEPSTNIFWTQASKGVVSGTIFQGFRWRNDGDIEDRADKFKHQIDVIDSIDLSNNALSLSDIFPNWWTGTTDEERLTMDAAWAAANPGIGPDWLTTA